PRPPRSALFPYTTLFRSGRVQAFASELERVRRLLPHTTLSPQEKTQARMVLNQLENACHDVLASGSVSTEWIATTLRPTEAPLLDRKSTRLNSSHVKTSY